MKLEDVTRMITQMMDEAIAQATETSNARVKALALARASVLRGLLRWIAAEQRLGHKVVHLTAEMMVGGRNSARG